MLRAVAAAAAGRGLLARGARGASSTADVMAEDKEHILNLYARNPIVLERGEGCHVYDSNGRKYLDFYAGIAVSCLGHGDKEWLNAVTDQAGKLSMAANLFYNRPAVELAEALKSKSFADKVFFCNSGTEANEGALKMARKYGYQEDASGKKHSIIAFQGGFHGRTMGSLSATANEKYRKPFMPLVPGFSHLPLNDIETFEKAMNDTVCGVIVEPVQGEGGLTSAMPEFLRAIRAACDRHNALFIVDEIQCGLGRTGRLWGHELSGVVPDVMTLAKALGNGIPIGAVLANKRAAGTLTYGDHGTTFGGQPIACRAGKVVFDRVSQPAFLQQVDRVGALLKKEIAAINSPIITGIRGRGLIVGIAIDLERAGIKDLSPLVRACHDRGLLIITAGPNVLRLLPPLVAKEEHVLEASAILRDVFAQYK